MANFVWIKEIRFKGIYLSILILILLGFVLRFLALDQKVFWLDEAYTMFRISGYVEVDFLRQFSFDRIVDANLLQHFQRPHAETGLMETLKGLATEEPQLAPLYFVLLYGWVKLFGSSIAAVRSLRSLS
jgi:uncharacterized membrane protein